MSNRNGLLCWRRVSPASKALLSLSDAFSLSLPRACVTGRDRTIRDRGVPARQLLSDQLVCALRLHRQFSRPAFLPTGVSACLRFFSSLFLQWFYSFCLLNVIPHLAIEHAVAASVSDEASDAVEAILTGIAKLRKQFSSRYIRRALTRSSKNSSISFASKSSSPFTAH